MSCQINSLFVRPFFPLELFFVHRILHRNIPSLSQGQTWVISAAKHWKTFMIKSFQSRELLKLDSNQHLLSSKKKG
jgi:hypothetical protein